MRRWTATTLVLLSLVTAARAEPQPERRLAAAYDFFVGGVSIGRVEIDAVLAEGGYSATTAMRTKGVLDMMLRGRLTASASGSGQHPAAFEPEHYETWYASRVGEQSVTMGWKDRRPASRKADPPFEARSHDIDPLEQGGTLDPVSGLTAVFLPLARASVCNRTIPIFDGRRRYDLILAPPRDIEETRDRAPPPDWHEPLIHCLGVYERIAGFEPDVMEKGRFFAFDIWFEQPRSGIARAVRIGGKTRLGYAIGNLALPESEARRRTGAKLSR